MKIRLISLISLLFAMLAVTQLKAQAQTLATATWTLAPSSPSATVNGSVSAFDQTLGPSISGIVYGSSFTIGGVSNTGWQRTGTTGGLPATYAADGYIDYKITPTGGQYFTMNKFEAELLGGGTGLARAALYWSVDNFVTSQTVGTCSYNSTNVGGSTTDPIVLVSTSGGPADGVQKLTVPTFITVAPTQTLIIRMYAWCGSTNKYLASKNVKITGVTSASSLPLTLKSFSVGSQNKLPKLFWTTTNEVNVKSFDVEKSTDGIYFKSIYSNNANNAIYNEYSFIDYMFTNQLSYYRLKITEKDGKYFYSNVLSIDNKAFASLSIYPNPAIGANSITIKFPFLTNQNSIIQIFTEQGSLVKQFNLSQNTMSTLLDISNLKCGSYLISVNDLKSLQVVKFIKK